jgi:hypothetical protein
MYKVQCTMYNVQGEKLNKNMVMSRKNKEWFFKFWSNFELNHKNIFF